MPRPSALGFWSPSLWCGHHLLPFLLISPPHQHLRSKLCSQGPCYSLLCCENIKKLLKNSHHFMLYFCFDELVSQIFPLRIKTVTFPWNSPKSQGVSLECNRAVPLCQFHPVDSSVGDTSQQLRCLLPTGSSIRGMDQPFLELQVSSLCKPLSKDVWEPDLEVDGLCSFIVWHRLQFALLCSHPGFS